MQRIILFILSSILFGGLYAQNIVNDTISVHFLNSSMSEFVENFEHKTGLKFIYKEDWLKTTSITVNVDNVPINEVLDKALFRTPYTYIFVEPNFIILVFKESFVNKIPFYDGIEISYEQAEGLGQQDKNKYLKGRQPDEKIVINIGNGVKVVNSNKVNIQAKIIDIENNDPLIGATLFIEKLKTGAATGVDGNLTLSLYPGIYSAEVSSIGMATVKCLLNIKSSGAFKIEMVKEVRSIDEVTVNAEQKYKIRGSEVGLDKIAIKSVKELPSLMGEKDIIKISQMLPGVVSVSEGSSGINVRGGSADQNMFYIGNIPLYNTSHLFGFFSAINSTVVKNFSIYKGHVPAKFGGRLSSIFDVETRTGNKNKFFAQGGISPISANISAEGPIVKDKGTYVVSARSSYSDWILQRLPNDDLRNSSVFFYDLSGNINYEFDENNSLSLFNYYSSDFFNLNNLNEYYYSNLGSGLNYFHRFTSRLKSNVSLVYARYNFNSKDMNNATEAYSHNYSLQHTEAKASLAWLLSDKHSLSFGINSILYNINRGIIEPYGINSKRSLNNLGKENAIESAMFVDDSYEITKNLKVYGGVRFSVFNNIGPSDVYLYDENLPREYNAITDTLSFENGKSVVRYSNPELRLAFDYELSSFNSIKFSYNEMSQNLFLLSNTYSVAPTDQWKLSDYYIEPARSRQISGGYYQNIISMGLSVSSELYYKTSGNVLEFKDGANFINTKDVEIMTLQGDQEAYGAEFMVAKDEGKLNGWISYAYSRSFMKFKGEQPWEEINDGIVYPSNFDKPHVLNVVANYKFNRRIILSSNLLYSTGRPITLPQSIYFMNGSSYADYSDRNEYRIPDYFRMDLSLTIEGNLKANKKLHSSWSFNVYNLTGRKNPYTVYFVSQNYGLQGYQYSVIGVPVITVSWNFKLGNYAAD
jgi:hypothetical protein